MTDIAVIVGQTSEQLELFAHVNELEAAVAIPEAAASGLRWEQAADVVALLDSGMTQQAVADGWHNPKTGRPYSQRHVSFVAKTYRTFQNLGSKKPEWNTAYHSPQVRPELSDSVPHVSQNTGDNEWYTPAPFIEAARVVLGRIDVDPASSPTANETVQAESFFTAADNGLEQSWLGRVWINPPYSKGLIEPFTAKLLTELDAGRCTMAVCLTNNSTDTKWFQSLAAKASAVCFPEGRVRFWQPDGTPGAPLQGQALCYFGDNPEAFAAVFTQFGFVSGGRP